MLEHLLKRTIHRYCTDILSYFLQCCKYCFFTALFSQFWCLYSLRKHFFTVSSARLSLPTNNSFLQQIFHFYKWCENILTSHKYFMAQPVTPYQTSYHDYQRLFVLAYILASWSCWPRKVWASFYIRAFILPGFAFIHLSQKPYHPKLPHVLSFECGSAPQLLFSSERLLSFTSQGQHWGGKARPDELFIARCLSCLTSSLTWQLWQRMLWT